MVLKTGLSVSAIKNHKAWILAKDFERFPARLSSVSSSSRGVSFSSLSSPARSTCTDRAQRANGSESVLARPAHGVPASPVAGWAMCEDASAEVLAACMLRCFGIAKPISAAMTRAIPPTVTAGMAASVKPVGVSSPPAAVKIAVRVAMPRAMPISRVTCVSVFVRFRPWDQTTSGSPGLG